MVWVTLGTHLDTASYKRRTIINILFSRCYLHLKMFLQLKLDTTLRDCLLLIGDVSLGNNPLKSSNGTLILTSASLGKAKFFLKSMKVASRLYHSRNTPLPFGCSEDSGVQWFVGNVKKMSIKVAEEDNLRSLKHMINLDGDIYNCVPNLEVEFLQEVLPVFYNDTSNL